ncbi:MAG: sigma 54-interacting transcriptional regulator [Bacillota bacterium]
MQAHENHIGGVALSEILHTFHNGILIVDNAAAIRFVNRMAATILGLDPDNVLGKAIQEVIPDSELPKVLLTGVSRLGQKYSLGSVTIIAHHSPFFLNGKIAGAVSEFQEITEMEKMFIQLRNLQELSSQLEAILESSYDGIYITGSDGETLRVNKAYERITGLKVSDLVGKNMKDLESKGVITNSITFKVVETKQPVTAIQKTATGKEIFVTGSPIFDQQGKVAAVVTNVRDMSQLKALQEDLQQSKRLTFRYHNQLLRLQARDSAFAEEMVARSKKMLDVLELAQRVAMFDSTILILGESGVGKDLVAELIYRSSPRSTKGSFIRVNCGAIPYNLLDSELFGYEEGAFTGARRGGKPGLFELADQGVLFLDEIGELPLDLQVKLLRVIQTREFNRLGGVQPIKVDVRLITATNKDLIKEVAAGRFRQDLYYRINVVPIIVPPLRERNEDIIPLAVYYLESFNRKYGYSRFFSPAVLEAFLSYEWPGNVRELINVVERLVVTAEHDHINVERLPAVFMQNNKEIAECGTWDFHSAREALEKKLIEDALKMHRTTRKAAKALGISQSGLIRRISKFGLKSRK